MQVMMWISKSMCRYGGTMAFEGEMVFVDGYLGNFAENTMQRTGFFCLFSALCHGEKDMSERRFCNGLFFWAAVAAFFSSLAVPAVAETIIFQQDLDGYTRAQDASIRWAYTRNYGDSPGVDTDRPGDAGSYEMWSTNGGATTVLEAGQFYQRTTGSLIGGGAHSFEAGPVYRYSRILLRFRDVIGTGPGQVAPDAVINQATLKLYNTPDLGAVGAAGNAAHPEVVYKGSGSHSDPNNFLDNSQRGVPRLNAGLMAVYPLLKSVRYGTSDGVAAIGESTGRSRRRGKELWSQRCHGDLAPNDPFAIAHNCGPADVGDPHSTPGTEEYDSQHSAAIEVPQDASEGFKDFDVTGLFDFITGHGVFISAISPPGELPTVNLNYGQAYRSNEFGGIDASAEDIATRPMLVIELGDSTVLGDADGDGVVDVADLGVLGANFNQSNMTIADGDFNDDGLVDVADLGILGANWSASQATGNASALVPEPATLSLLAMSVLVVGRRRQA